MQVVAKHARRWLNGCRFPRQQHRMHHRSHAHPPIVTHTHAHMHTHPPTHAHTHAHMHTHPPTQTHTHTPQGAVNVLYSGREIDRLYPGDFFGEIALTVSERRVSRKKKNRCTRQPRQNAGGCRLFSPTLPLLSRGKGQPFFFSPSPAPAPLCSPAICPPRELPHNCRRTPGTNTPPPASTLLLLLILLLLLLLLLLLSGRRCVRSRCA